MVQHCHSSWLACFICSAILSISRSCLGNLYKTQISKWNFNQLAFTIDWSTKLVLITDDNQVLFRRKCQRINNVKASEITSPGQSKCKIQLVCSNRKWDTERKSLNNTERDKLYTLIKLQHENSNTNDPSDNGEQRKNINAVSNRILWKDACQCTCEKSDDS